MKIHQQFDLNSKAISLEKINDIPKVVNEIPALVEKLIKNLLHKGYIVIKEGASSFGVPNRITVIKEFNGPFVTHFSIKTKEDFTSVSRALGIEKLFE